MSNLQKFLNQVKNNTCVNNMVVDLSQDCSGTCFCTGPFFRNYNTHSMEQLASAIASGNCKPGLIINLYSNYLGDQGAKAIAEALRSPNRPANFGLTLAGNKITDKGFRYLVEAIMAGPTTPGLSINLCGKDGASSNEMGYGANHITEKGAAFFAQALEQMIVNNKCPQDLIFDLTENGIGNNGATAIANALESALSKNPAPQTITLKLSYIDPDLLARIQGYLDRLRNPANISNKSAYAENKPTLYSVKVATTKEHSLEKYKSYHSMRKAAFL